MHGAYYTSNFGEGEVQTCAATSVNQSGVGVLSNGDFVVVYRSGIESLYGNGVLVTNVTLLGRIDGNSGRTVWAKQVNVTLNFGLIAQCTNVKVDPNDNIWTLLSFVAGDDYRSALLEHNKNGDIMRLIVIAKQNIDTGYSMLHLELFEIYFNDVQTIIAQANSIPSEDGLNYDLNSPYPDTLFFKLNLNGTTEWITVLDVLNSKDPSRGFMLDTDIYGTLSANYHLFCVVKLLVSNGQLDKYNCYNYTTEAIQTTVYFTIISKIENMLFIINIRSNEDSTSANSLIIINADTLLPMKSFQVKDSSYEFTPDLYSHIAFRMNGELYFLASNIWNHFLMKFDYALNIVSTQVSFIQNYFNVTLTPSYYTHKYINGTLYWSSKRRYSFSENTYVYVTFLAKTDVFLNADLCSYNIFQSMHDYSQMLIQLNSCEVYKEKCVIYPVKFTFNII